MQLAPKEFDLLWDLLDHRGLVLTRDQLLERVWGYTFAGDTRTVDVHVRQLRRKLGDACPVVTVWGVGYKVSTEPKAAQASERPSRRFRHAPGGCKAAPGLVLSRPRIHEYEGSLRPCLPRFSRARSGQHHLKRH